MRKTSSSHTAGSMGSSVRGVFRSHGISEFSCFCCLLLLPDLPRPPTLHVFFGLQDLKQCLSSSYSCMLIYCIQAQFQLFCQLSFGAVTLMIYSVDKGWAAWSAWHSSQLSVRRMCVSTQMEKRRAVETLVFHKLTIEQRTFKCCTKLSKKYR